LEPDHAQEANMKRKSLFTAVLLFPASLLLFTFLLFAGEKDPRPEKTPQAYCPVMGGKIDKNVHVDYQGQRIYFCCSGCPAAFQADPERYMKKLEEQGVLLESVQTACPISGKEINKAVYSDYKGRRIYFCSEAHKKQFDKDPEAVLKHWGKTKPSSSRSSSCSGR
jgi:YHS domain-containing protein